MLTGSQWRWSSLCSGADIDTGAVVVGASVRQFAQLSETSEKISRGNPADLRLLHRGCPSRPEAASVGSPGSATGAVGAAGAATGIKTPCGFTCVLIKEEAEEGARPQSRHQPKALGPEVGAFR